MKKLLSLLAFIFLCLPIFSFQFEPIVHDFEPSGINSRKSFQIINPDKNPIAVKVYITHREMDLYGNETLEEATDLFFVYPKQVIVPPGSTQTIRVQWLGDNSVSEELPFRVIAEQLPININNDSSGVRILLAYHGTVYVIPENFQYGLKVNAVSKGMDSEDNDKLLIELENTGNTHIILDDPVLTLTGKSFLQKQIVLSGTEQLSGLINENILAGKRRVFEVPWPEGLESNEIDATIEIDPIR